MFGFLETLVSEFGDIAAFDIGQSPFILVNGTDNIRELFFRHEKNLRKPEFVKESNRGQWGDGLTTVEGAEWRMRRRQLRPMFRAAPVADRLPVVAQLTEEMLDRWHPGMVFDATREFRLLTARIAARQVLDADIETCGHGKDRSGLLPLEPALGEEYQSCVGGDASAPLIMTRPRAPRPFAAVTKIVDDRITSQEMRSDILSHLVHMRFPDRDKADRDDILAEVMQLLFAGHLTIPFCLRHFWRDIARSEIRETVETEARHLIGKGVLESTGLASSYCLAALRESMRLTPPAPILYREVDTRFELSGYEFARNIGVWVSPMLMHRDHRYFPQPTKLLPERFVNPRDHSTVLAAYMPFGAGPRVCVASQQAFQQMALICLLVARRFRLRPMDDSADHFEVMAQPTGMV